jgi:two-component system chemotaxis response regulator CheB
LKVEAKQRRREPLKVLVVDDSPVVRQVVRQILVASDQIGLVDVASNASLAMRKIKKIDPDVVTLDVEMPGKDGLETLAQIMAESPRPVIMLSAYTAEGADKTLQALELGAVDCIQKPSGRLSRDIQSIEKELVAKVCVLGRSRSKLTRLRKKLAAKEKASQAGAQDFQKSATDLSKIEGIVAIGASTGGTDAIRHLLENLPSNLPLGLVVVQHMPPTFTGAFAKRLNQLCRLQVQEAKNRDLIYPGRVLLAPGHSHMEVRQDEMASYVELHKRPAVSGHRPSVDVLFSSVAAQCKEAAMGILLTGMGKDGAEGLLQMKQQGALTVAQNEQSCVVFGMPKAAVQLNAAQQVLGIMRIPKRIEEWSRSRMGKISKNKKSRT